MMYIHPRQVLRKIKEWRMLHSFRIWLYKYRSHNHICGEYKAMQPVQAMGEGRIITKGTQFGYTPSPDFYSYSYLEARYRDATIEIGASTINNHFVCVAEHSTITIGDGCLIGANVEIINSNFHSLSVQKHHRGGTTSKPVVIENNVFIGNNVKIMKGVRVGYGAVIANNAVVFDNVAPEVIVRGNPAVFYAKINN